jgi:transposase
MFSYLSPEARVRQDHPLRAIRRLTDDVFTRLSPRFARLYSDMGRPSIPPEQLLRALLLQSLYTIRSERLLMEEIDYSILFRWFIGLSLDEPIWSPTTFSKNRDRLLEGDIAAAFFDAVRAQAEAAGLLSDEHFTVDGTMGTAERDAAVVLLTAEARAKTVGGDKNFDVASFVAAVRELDITPHVAQKAHSAIDARTTRHAGYEVSQRKRKLIEQVFGWMKTVGGLRKLRHRGGALVDWVLTFTAAAYNLVRMRTLLARA